MTKTRQKQFIVKMCSKIREKLLTEIDNTHDKALDKYNDEQELCGRICRLAEHYEYKYHRMKTIEKLMQEDNNND